MGRKKQESVKTRKNIMFTDEALEILTPQKNHSKYVCEAIILKHKVDSESVKQFKS